MAHLRIRDVQTRAVLAPIRRQLRTSTGAVTQAPLLLIDLHTEEGVTGHAYLFGIQAFTLKPLYELVQTLAGMIKGDELAPFVLYQKLRVRLTLLGPHNLTGMALSGLDMAAWDALARGTEVPLVSLLGGLPGRVPAYNSNGLGIMPPDEAGDEAVQLVEEGFGAIKIRLGRPSLRDDLAAVRAVRKRIPEDIVLMADFNQALSVNEAIQRGRALDGEQLYWIEEPVRADDFAGCARVASELKTPVQIGENFSGPLQMQDALLARSCDFVMPDAQRIGGVTGWLRAASLAYGWGHEMSSHLFPEISSHLLRVTPTCHWLEYVDWANRILEEPLEIREGAAWVPDRPGTGVAWNEEAVERYRLD
jgi:mandelate racemase